MFVIIIITEKRQGVYIEFPCADKVRTYVPEINNKKIKQGIHISKRK